MTPLKIMIILLLLIIIATTATTTTILLPRRRRLALLLLLILLLVLLLPTPPPPAKGAYNLYPLLGHYKCEFQPAVRGTLGEAKQVNESISFGIIFVRIVIPP